MFEVFRFWNLFFLKKFKVSRMEKRPKPKLLSWRIYAFFSWWLFYLKSFRTQNLCFKINDFDIHIFLNFSNDLGRRNDINQSCSTGRCMQLYSWWLCHLNSFRTQNLCFKINDFAIHIFFTFPNDFGGRNDLHQSCNWSDLKLFNTNFFI